MLRRKSAEGMHYLLFRPRQKPDGEAPLIVFLHGWGERGDSRRKLNELRVHSLPRLAIEDGVPDPFPFLVACPQTPHSPWADDAGRVAALVDELVADEGADRDRCYLTGISMGAVGTWELAAAAPEMFAALAPVSWDVPDVAAHVDAPAWVFVGGGDHHLTDVDVEASLYAHRERDDRARFTLDPDGDHSGQYWNRVYARPDLYEWLLSWRRE